MKYIADPSWIGFESGDLRVHTRPARMAGLFSSMPSASLIEKCCLIGNPVAGNPTQYLVEQAFARNGLDWRFMTFEVDPSRLADAMSGLRALGFHGIKIGRPFHEPVFEHLDELSPAARACGSVNCVVADGPKLIGDNTEGAALLELVRQHIDPAGQCALVIGAGRLARALALALAGAGVASVQVMSRNPEAGQQLVERIRQQTATAATLLEFENVPIAMDPQVAVIVNATSLGAQNPAARLPINVETLNSKTVVAEVAYNTARTWLTQQAAEQGCPIIDGLSLYVQQTALAFRAWTGVMPDTVEMREAAEEFLGI